uniref:Interleukin 12 receptor, beta 2a, like n=1 Tax=Nothobranchius kadleci TaxID=1051664 RepID=A0A1A8DRP1_NOTKA
MATPTRRWLLPVLLVILPSGYPSSGPPAPPSEPECYRPCSSHSCSVIRCVWTPDPESDHSTNYSLHWEPTNTDDDNIKGGRSYDGLIHRENFRSHGELRVWVQAQNQNGSVKSQDALIDTEAIKKPPPPLFLSNHHGSLEVTWSVACVLQPSQGTCEVRYRAEDDQGWPQAQYEDGLHNSFEVPEPRPGSEYEFQVRCACDSSLVSDWSEIYRIRSAEAAPVGEVDVWMDCVTPFSSFDCFLTWKNLSISEARGFILGYQVTVSYSNGTVKHINVSTVDPSSVWAYDEMKWYLTSSLKRVSSVYVSAYNSIGTGNASHLVVPEPGEHTDDQIIDLQMTEENLTVSWTLPPHFPDNVKHYVVQYRECWPGRGLDWIKVDKSRRTVSFKKGVFKKYTSYQVSLFVVSDSNQIRLISTAVAYSVQGVPSAVPSFNVSVIAATDVTLFWEPVSCSKRNGKILHYQIGVEHAGTQTVYNVSVTPDHGTMTYKLPGLSPGRKYKVWIRAVTAAGPGPSVTTTLKTKHVEDLGHVIHTLVPVGFLFVTIIFVALCVIRGPRKVCPVLPRCLYEKVPDPSNSHIFKHMRHQISEPLNWICIPLYEPSPKISLLEIVEVKSKALGPDRLTRSVLENDCLQMSSTDVQRGETIVEDKDRMDPRYGREEYSKMIDSDEERSEESSDDGQFSSGYEQHFMPNPLEIRQN